MTRARRAWILVALLWMVGLLNYIDRQVIFSLFPPLQAELKLSNLQLGLLGTMFLWIYGVLSPFSGFLADRFSRRQTILLSLVVWSVVTWVTGHARNSLELLSVRAAMGISEACYVPAALALIAENHPGPTRSRAIGLHQSGTYFGFLLGGVGGGWVGQHYGWRSVFSFLGVLGVAYALFLAFGFLRTAKTDSVSPPITIERPHFLRALHELFAVHNFLALCSLNAISSIGFWILYTWLPLHLYERFHMSLAEAGFSATFYIQAASLVGVVSGGWLADRWSLADARGRLLTQVIGFLVAGPALLVVGYTYSRFVLVSCLTIVGIGRGFYDCNTMPVMCQLVRSRLRATGFGIYNMASCVMSGTMTAVAGALKSTLGLGTAFEISGLIVCVCGLFLLRIRFRPDSQVGDDLKTVVVSSPVPAVGYVNRRDS